MANASPLLYACLLFSLVLFTAGADIQEKVNPANPPIVNANTTANSSSLEAAASGANTQETNKTDVVVVNSQTNSTNGTQLVARLDETNKPNSGNQSANSTTKKDDEKQVKSGADQKLGKRQVEVEDEENEKEEPKLDENENNESDTAKLVYETEGWFHFSFNFRFLVFEFESFSLFNRK